MKENLRTSLKALICKIYKEELEEDDLEEITTTGDIAGYETPYAFSDDDEKKKRKMKKANGAAKQGYDEEARLGQSNPPRNDVPMIVIEFEGMDGTIPQLIDQKICCVSC